MNDHDQDEDTVIDARVALIRAALTDPTILDDWPARDEATPGRVRVWLGRLWRGLRRWGGVDVGHGRECRCEPCQGDRRELRAM